MADLQPFRRTGRLISEIDEYIDKVSESVMVVERTFADYLDRGPDDDSIEQELDQKFGQIRDIEARADEIRRGVANELYSEMLMPDTRGDVLSLLDQVDETLDDCVHLLANLAIERPPLVGEFVDGFRSMMREAAEAAQAMLRAARAYFKDSQAVRDHVHKITFHEKETTAIAMRAGKAIYDSELPLEGKRQLSEWLSRVRTVAANADDIGGQLSVLAVKRSF